MKIKEKVRQLEARLNAAYTQNDEAAVKAARAALWRISVAVGEAIDCAEVVHYDFCTTKYRGNAAFVGKELISAYLRENDEAAPEWIDENGHRIPRIGGAIRLSWSPDEEARGLGGSDGIDPEAVGRYARMYGRRSVTHGDLAWYLPEDASYIPDVIWNSTLIEEVDEE